MRASTCLGAIFALISTIMSTAVWGAECLPKLSNGNICTAKDLRALPTVIEGPAACTEGELISVRLRFTITGIKNASVVGANERYQIGMFIGNNGQPAVLGDSCTLASLLPLEPPLNLGGGSGGYRNLNGDACGDIRAEDVTVRNVQLDDVLCRDSNGDGKLDFSHALTWETNSSLACANPLDESEYVPRQSSQCVIKNIQDIRIIVEPDPAIEVVKNAIPEIVQAPGGTVTYTVLVQNNSDITDPVVIDTLEDDLYGDLNGQGDCLVPQTIPPGGFYFCSFEQSVSGNPDDVVTDIVTAAGTDNEGVPVEASDSASVLVTAAPPPDILAMDVAKFASPDRVDEPGGDVLFRVIVQNLGTVPLNIVDLMDDVYGDLNGRGDCTVPREIPVLGQYECSFVEFVTGAPGDVITNIVTATHDSESGTLEEDGEASVTVQDVAALLQVQKIASPGELPEPGGDVSYGVDVHNASLTDAISVNSLVDNLHGDLNGQGNCAVPQILAPGQSYNCQFIAAVNGPPGSVITDTITAGGQDDDGNDVEAEGGAHVQIVDQPASVTLTKLALPSSLTAPGGNVSFAVRFTNTSAVDAVDLLSLVDDPYGDLNGQGDCVLPQLGIAPGASYECTFVQAIAGNNGDIFTDTLTALSTDDDGNDLPPAIAEATVTIGAPELSIAVIYDPLPASLPEPGGDVVYQLTAVNTSGVSLTITALDDSVFGNLDGQGDCQLAQPALQPGDSYGCSFQQAVSGNAGDQFINLATVMASGGDNGDTQGSDDAVVDITDVASSIVVTKAANPANVTEPGEVVSFQVEVINTSAADIVTIDSLTDNIHGDLNGQGDCSVPFVLDLGESRPCSFSAQVNGLFGASETDIVSATGTDDDGSAVGAEASARVDITASPIAIQVTKTAAQGAAMAGDTVEFAVEVTNQSEALALNLVVLTDDKFGDLDGRGSCQLPQLLALGASYSCSFTGTIQGAAAGVHRNVVSGTARVDGGSPDNPREVTDSDSSEVVILAVPVQVINVDTLSRPLLVILAGLLLALVFSSHTMRRARHAGS